MIKIKSHVRFISLLLLMTLLPLSAALAAKDQNRASVDELLELAGLMPVIEDIPIIMGAGIKQKIREHEERGEDSKKFDNAMSPLVNNFYSREKVLDSIAQKLGPLLQGQRGVALRKLLSSSMAKQIVKLKTEARTEENLQAIKNTASDHDQDNIPKERLDLFEELDNASADTEFFIAVQALSIDAMLRLSNAYSLKSQNKPISGLNSNVLSSTYELLLRPSRYTTMMTYRHIFREFDNREIQQFVSLYRQSHLQWLLQNAMVAISTAMDEATTGAIKQLASS